MTISSMTLRRPALRRGAFATVLFAALAVSGPSFAESLEAAVKSGNAAWNDAFNRGDAAGVAQLYTSDAQVLPPNKTPAKGTEAIRDFFKGLIEGGYSDHEIETLEVREAGDLGFQTGRWRALAPATDGGERPKAEGLIVTIHERQKDGTWKIRVHTFN